MDTELGDIFTINQNVTLTQLQEPEQDREESTLSRSGTTDDEHSGAGLDTDVDLLEDGLLGTAGVGCLDTLEDDLTTGRPGAFNGVGRQVGGSILGKFLGVLLKTLDGAHLRLDGGGGLDQKVHDVRESGGVSQSGAELGGVHNLGGLPEHSDGENNQSGEEFQAEGEPDLGRIAKVHGLVAIIDQVSSATCEVTLTLEGGDGGDTVEGLVDLGLEGRPHTGFEPLQLTEGSTVETEEEPIDEEQGSQNTEDDRGTPTEDGNGGDQGAETSDGLENLGHEALVDGFHILGEAVDDTTGRVSVEPTHGSANDTGESLVVEGAGSSEDTEEDEGVDDKHQESGGNADAVVDTEIEFDRLLELVRRPPSEPLVHHNGPGLLGEHGENQSNDKLPSTCSFDIRPPSGTADGAGGDILVSNNASGGGILSFDSLLDLGDFLTVGLLVGLPGAFLNTVYHLTELAVLTVELGVGSLLGNGTVVQDDDVVSLGKEVECLGDQDTSLAVESVEETFLEDGTSNARVEGSEGVVQQVDVGIGVDGTGQGKTGLLATGQVGTTLDDLTGNTVGETLEVRSKGSSTDSALKTTDIHGLAEGDVLLDGGGLNPCLLGAIGDGAISDDLGPRSVIGPVT